MSSIAQLRHEGFLTFLIIPVFDTFETLVTFAAVIIVNYVIGDARTHWLEGLILVVIYVVIGISILYVFFNSSLTRAFTHRTQSLSWHLVCRVRLTKGCQKGQVDYKRRPGLIEGTNGIYAMNLDVVAIPMMVSFFLSFLLGMGG